MHFAGFNFEESKTASCEGCGCSYLEFYFVVDPFSTQGFITTNVTD